MPHPRGPAASLAAIVLAANLAACSCSPDARADGGAPDGGAPDGGAPDGGAPDGGAPDGGALDAGEPDGGPPDAGEVHVLFELSRGAPISEFYALPFPNDLRRRDAGTLDLDDHPRLTAIAARWIDAAANQTAGFGTNAAMFVRFSDAIDVATLPGTPQETLSATATVYLVNLGTSPDRGGKIPLECRFRPDAGASIGPSSLACAPVPGFPLQAATPYALVVTRRLHGAGGRPVGRSLDFDAVMGTATSDATLQHAQAVYAPLTSWLDAAQSADERADVAGAAVFTTQEPTSLIGKAREVITQPCDAGQTFPDCIPMPAARNVAARDAGASWLSFEGIYDSPNFQTGAPPYQGDGGEIVVDGAGRPIPQRLEAVRFATSIPSTAMPATGWPLVLYAHGLGGSYRSFLSDGTAQVMAGEGLAVISIDQVLHGPRDPTLADPVITFFNLANPWSARDNVRQGAIDHFQLVRLVKGLTYSDGATVHRFDSDRLYFMAHSHAGTYGPLFLAWEPAIKAAVLSGAGGLNASLWAGKTQPIDFRALLPVALGEPSLDAFNNVLALQQTFIEPADPLNFGRLIAGVKDVYQSEGIVDHYVPPSSIEGLGVALGLSPVSPVVRQVAGFQLAAHPPLTAPVAGNSGGKTGVFVQYSASVEDGHFVVFDVPDARRQHARFLGTHARTGVATLVP